MSISIDQVEHIAGLARLKLTEAEKRYYSEQLSQILLSIETINKCNTDGVSPTAQLGVSINNLRPDEPLLSGLRDKIIAQSPAVGSLTDEKPALIKVPPVFADRGGI